MSHKHLVAEKHAREEDLRAENKSLVVNNFKKGEDIPSREESAIVWVPEDSKPRN